MKMVQLHIMSREAAKELEAALTGDIEFTEKHIKMYLRSFAGLYPDKSTKHACDSEVTDWDWEEA